MSEALGFIAFWLFVALLYAGWASVLWVMHKRAPIRDDEPSRLDRMDGRG